MTLYLLGRPGAIHVTDFGGSTSTSPGFPFLELWPPTQYLIAGLVASDDSILASDIEALSGAVSLAAGLFDDADAIYAPVVTYSYGLSPGPIANDDAFSAPSIKRYLLPSLVDSDDAFNAPTIALPPVRTLLPGLVGSDDGFFAPTVVRVGATRTLLPGFVTDADAFYAPAVAFPVQRTLLPSRITDAETFYAPVMGFDRTLRPPLVSAGEILYAAYSIDTAKPPKEIKLRAPKTFDLDVIYPAMFPRTVQLVVIDPEFIYAAILDISYPLTAAFVASDDTFKSPFVAMVALPETVVDVDTVFGGLVSLFLVPELLAADDEVSAADVGWQVIAEFTDAADGVFDTFVSAYNDVLPETWLDEETIDTYPFFLQAVSGGIPVPKPIALLGSISQPRRLRGSLASRARLKGSISGPRRLKGSIAHR